jgi:hypothetical protein
MRAIAEKADRLITLHIPQGHDYFAVVTADEELEPSDFLVED